MSTILLAECQITPGDRLVIELVESLETPPVILLRWPTQASVIDPLRFSVAANAIMSVVAGAVARLSQISSGEL